jgi:hypothetical protein
VNRFASAFHRISLAGMIDQDLPHQMRWHYVEMVGLQALVLYAAVRKMIIHFARMHRTAFAHKIQEELGLPPARRRPRLTLAGGNGSFRAGMYPRLQRSGHEAVIDEHFFLDAELAIPLFEIAG